MPTLDAQKQLISDLWLDQPDAQVRINQRERDGALSAEDAAKLRQFADRGYTMFTIDLDESFATDFEADVEQLFRERPFDLAIASTEGDRTSFRDFPETYETSSGYRIADLHSHGPRARELYLHQEIFRLVRLIFDAEPIAFQSLYFQFGSEQSLHRDPMFVVTKPPSHLCAAWIALEDITPESGPLLYVPGSHRMPWFEFEPDKINVASKADTKDKRAEWVGVRTRMLDELGLEVEEFTPRRGDVFIWHGGLLHGGARRRDAASTRKSFVVHYSTAEHYRSRKATMNARAADGTWINVPGTTTDVLERGGCRGIDNPLRHARLPQLRSSGRRSLFARIKRRLSNRST